MDVKQNIIDTVNSPQYVPLEPAKLLESLNAGIGADAFFKILVSLEKDGEIVYTKKGKVTAASQMGIFKGVFMGTGRGFGFVRLPGQDRDIFIPASKTHGAFSGDTVVVRRLTSAFDERTEGEIVRVVSRGADEFCAVVRKDGRRIYAVPENASYGDFCEIDAKASAPFNAGDKVWVKIVKYPSGREDLKVKVLKAFGSADTLKANYLSILHGYGIYEQFPSAVLEEADKASQRGILNEDLEGRADLRSEIIFTIDSVKTKDIDDAISIKRDEAGRLILGVHIADVSFYVRHGSALDAEAFKRGTSVYFADKVVPMLPKSLSNGICSLDEKQDRLAVSVFMTIDQKGEVIDYDIKRSVIRSVKKCAYEEINLILASAASDELKAAYAEVMPSIHEMLELAEILHKRRIARGAIELETTEPEIVLDDSGDPVEIKPRIRGVSERLIEEFMLAANETVARHLFWLQKPCLYRVHEEPDEEKAESFIKSANALGYPIRLRQGRLLSNEIAQVLKKAEGTKHEPILSAMALRSLMKARYSKTCAPHFGLASEQYCHFTSPIRRYPDLFVHRVLTALLTGSLSPQFEHILNNFAESAAVSSTDREIMADKAERDIDKLYFAAFMSKHIGEEFEGIISSVTSFGFFVELGNTVEGLVHITALSDDIYEFDERSLSLKGANTRKSYNIGDSVRVVCIGADISSGRIDFALPE